MFESNNFAIAARIEVQYWCLNWVARTISIQICPLTYSTAERACSARLWNYWYPIYVHPFHTSVYNTCCIIVFSPFFFNWWLLSTYNIDTKISRIDIIFISYIAISIFSIADYKNHISTNKSTLISIAFRYFIHPGKI